MTVEKMNAAVANFAAPEIDYKGAISALASAEIGGAIALGNGRKAISHALLIDYVVKGSNQSFKVRAAADKESLIAAMKKSNALRKDNQLSQGDLTVAIDKAKKGLTKVFSDVKALVQEYYADLPATRKLQLLNNEVAVATVLAECQAAEREACEVAAKQAVADIVASGEAPAQGEGEAPAQGEAANPSVIIADMATYVLNMDLATVQACQKELNILLQAVMLQADELSAATAPQEQQAA